MYTEIIFHGNRLYIKNVMEKWKKCYTLHNWFWIKLG